jgi:hypothetical protein
MKEEIESVGLVSIFCYAYQLLLLSFFKLLNIEELNRKYNWPDTIKEDRNQYVGSFIYCRILFSLMILLKTS